MPGLEDSIDITTDLNGQGDAQPYHGDDVPVNRQGDVPAVLPEKKDNDTPEPSLRDTLTNAFKGAEAPKADQQQAPPAEAAPPVPAPVKLPEGTVELVKVGDRWHRKDGSFASNEDITAFNAAMAAAQGQQAPVPEAPAWAGNLTELEKTQYAALPAEIRQFVERTMESVGQRAEQYKEYEQLEQLLGPRRQAWAAQGGNAYGALNQLFALSDFAGKSPGEFVMWFADQHRLDLDALLDERDAQLAANGGQPDPHIAGLQQQIQQLQNTIGGFTNQTLQQQQAQNMRLVQTFTEEKDAAGKPLHPYFAEVANDVAQHVSLIRQQQPFLPERDILQAAYDFATFNNPAVRAKVQADALQASKDAAAAEAARARQAGVSINGGPAGDASQVPNNANRTLREELVHAYNQSVG